MAFSVEDLYSITKTKGLIFEKQSSTIYDNYLIANVNRVIGDLFEENNMCRMFNGKAPLTTIPYVTSRSDEITYEDEYAKDIMPLGLGAYFLLDDDLQKYGIFITDYKNARIMHSKIVSQEVIDALTNS